LEEGLTALASVGISSSAGSLRLLGGGGMSLLSVGGSATSEDGSMENNQSSMFSERYTF